MATFLLGFIVQVVFILAYYYFIQRFTGYDLPWLKLVPTILFISALASFADMKSEELGFLVDFFWYVIFPVFYFRRQPGLSKVRRWFFGLMPYVVFSTYVEFLEVGLKTVIQEEKLASLIAVLIFYLVYMFMMTVLRLDFKVIKTYPDRPEIDRVLSLSYILILLVLILPAVLGFIFGFLSLPYGLFEKYYQPLSALLGAIIVFISLIIHNQVHDIQARELEQARESQLEAMSDYSHHIESLYQELRAFRHDYTNILTSLDFAIGQENLPMIRQIYQDVLARSDRKLYANKYDIAKLSQLTDDAMKSILSAKLMQAQSQGIDISLEVVHPIGTPDMSRLDFLTILSILLDNALEAALEADAPSITVAYFEDDTHHILLVENATQLAQVSLGQIFKSGYSTKGENRGIGLAKVRQLVDTNPHLTLNTKSRDHLFSQTLKVEKN